MAAGAGLESLLRSFLDLWHHVDGVEARRFDGGGPHAALRPFDRDAFQQHAAACRSIEGAVLDLEVETLDEEIDRTILLAGIRPRIKAWDNRHPGHQSPTFWTGRLVAALAERTGDPDALVAIPDWVAMARATLTSPPLLAVQIALDDLAPVRDQLERPEWWPVDKDLLAKAIAAVDDCERFLRHEVAPDPATAASGLGEDAIGWHLHHAALIEVGAQEAIRRLRRRAESLPAPDLDLAGAAQAYRHGLASRSSEIRQRIAPPAWLAGFALFVAEATDPAARGALARWCRRGLVDASYHLGLLSAPELATEADVPGTIRRPLESLETALLAIEWETVRGRFGGDTAGFLSATVEHGLFHPVLLGWRLGLG